MRFLPRALNRQPARLYQRHEEYPEPQNLTRFPDSAEPEGTRQDAGVQTVVAGIIATTRTASAYLSGTLPRPVASGRATGQPGFPSLNSEIHGDRQGGSSPVHESSRLALILLDEEATCQVVLRVVEDDAGPAVGVLPV